MKIIFEQTKAEKIKKKEDLEKLTTIRRKKRKLAITDFLN